LRKAADSTENKAEFQVEFKSSTAGHHGSTAARYYDATDHHANSEPS
jgi:hypothetical protein